MPLPTNEQRSSQLKKRPLLILDRDGHIGKLLIDVLLESLPVVFVTKRQDTYRSGIVHVPFTTTIPHIPNNSYAYLFVSANTSAEAIRLFPSLHKKTKRDNAKLIFLLHVRTVTTEKQKLAVEQLGTESIVFLYGDIFGAPHIAQSAIDDMLQQARNGHIVLLGHGLQPYYPILGHDIGTNVLSFLSSSTRNTGVFYLFPKEGITGLSIARRLLKHDPSIQVDFTEAKGETDPLLPLGQSITTNDYLEKKLILQYDQLSAMRHMPAKKTMPYRKKKRFPRAFLPLCFLFLILPYVLFFLISGIGWAFFFGSTRDLRNLQLNNARTKVSIAAPMLNTAQFLSTYDSKLLFFFHATRAGNAIQSLGQNGAMFAAIAKDGIDGVAHMQHAITSSSHGRDEFSAGAQQVKRAFLSLEEAEAQGNIPALFTTQLQRYDSDIQLLASVSDAMPLILGFEGKRTYLILFQNNMELRPGGGFIGSYALATVSNAKLSSLSIHDVYDADGQLRGHIEPPFALRRYLGASHWFLRDSNFSPNFSTNAFTVSRFLQLETGQKVDGVIAIDVTFLKDVLGALGSVYLPDYQTTVTQNNFYLLTQKAAEDNFFPGSTQKKDFLRSLAQAIERKITSGKNLPIGALMQAVRAALHQKDMLLAINEEAVEDQLRANHIAGEIQPTIKTDTGVLIQDSFGLSEANLGTNKVNNYINRSINQHVIISDTGDVHVQVTITYQNTSKPDSPFGGAYNNYFRFFAPQKTVLDAVALDGQEVTMTDAITNPDIFTKPGFVSPSGLEIEKTTEDNLALFGFFLSVPEQAERTIDLSYHLPPVSILKAPIFRYELNLIKQPGTLRDPYSLTITYPEAYEPISNTTFTKEGNDVTYFTPLDSDKDIMLSFQRK